MQNTVDKIFSALARAEEILHPKATLLRNVPRSLQLNKYACGARCVYSIFRYYKKDVSAKEVERLLRTDSEGTSVNDMRRVFRKFGLKSRIIANCWIRDIRMAIDQGSPVIVSLFSGEHYAMVFGFSERSLFVMNPSLGRMGSISVVVEKQKFLQTFDNWGLVVVPAK